MHSISFIFDRSVSPQQRAAVLDDIGKWKVIEKVAPLLPNSTHPDISRMANAYTIDGANVDDVVEMLNKLPEVESASIPPQRQIV